MIQHTTKIRHSYRVIVSWAVTLVSIFTLLTPALPGIASEQQEPAERPMGVPAANVSLTGVPAGVFAGESFTATVSFDNTGADPGYGPFIDVFVPTGLTLTSVSYLGDTSAITVLNLNAGNRHPLLYEGDPANPDNVQIQNVTGGTVKVLQLPFGSFTPTQPAIDVVLTFAVDSSLNAGTSMTIYARGGYQYASTPLNDWCCGIDPQIVSTPHLDTEPTLWTPSVTTTTTLYTVAKANSSSPSTVTGYNFPTEYTVTVTVAPNVTDFAMTVTDNLPDNLIYLGGLANGSQPLPTVSTGTVSTAPAVRAYGDTADLAWDIGPITTGAASQTLTMTYFMYSAEDDHTGTDLIPAPPASTTSTNEVNVTGTYTDPTLGPGTSIGVCTPPCASSTRTNEVLTLSKGASPTSVTPGDTVTYTLDFYVSDYFAIDLTTLVDTLPDGMSYNNDAAFQLWERGLPGSPFAFALGGSGYETTSGAGPTTLTWNLGTLLINGTDGPIRSSGTRHGQLRGACVTDTAPVTFDPNCIDGTSTPAASHGRITFTATVQDTYSGGTAVRQGDSLNNTADINSNLVDLTTLNPTVTGVPDSASAEVAVPTGTLDKYVAAIRDSTGSTLICSEFSGPACSSSSVVPPHGLVTYRLNYTLPTADVGNFTITDFLPLPIFAVDDPDADGAAGPSWAYEATITTNNATLPTAGVIRRTSADTFTSTSGLNPASGGITTDPAGNSLQMVYGDYSHPSSSTLTVDIVFTIQATDDPFTNGLKLTNQARVSESDSPGGTTLSNALQQIILGEPEMAMEKSVAAVTSTVGGTPTLTAAWSGVTWTAPGTISSDGFTGTIPANLPNIDAGSVSGTDVVKFALLLKNEGDSTNGAFDLRLSDLLDNTLYVIPPNGINLNLEYTDGTDIPLWDGSSTGVSWMPTGGLSNFVCGSPGGSAPDPCGLNGTLGDADDLFRCDPSVVGGGICGPDYVLGTGDDVTSSADYTATDYTETLQARAVFMQGIEIRDDNSSPSNPGACEAHGVTPNRGIIVASYDLQVRSGVAPGTTLTNTAKLENYSNTEGGDSFVPTDRDGRPTVTADVTIGVSSDKGIPPTPLTVGDTYNQSISFTIPAYTHAYVRPAQNGVNGSSVNLPAGVRIRDDIRDNGVYPTSNPDAAGLYPASGGATWSANTGCPVSVQGWTVGETTNDVRVYVVPDATGVQVFWVTPQEINNADATPCTITVGIPLEVKDVDPDGNPAGDGIFFTPPQDVENVRDQAQIQYRNSTGTNLSQNSSTRNFDVHQPVVRVIKGLVDVRVAGPTGTLRPATESARPGDVVTYSILLENRASDGARLTAYDVEFTDLLPRYLEFVTGSAAVSTDATYGNGDDVTMTPTVTGDATTTGQEIFFSDTAAWDIAVDGSLRLFFQATIRTDMPTTATTTADTIRDNIADVNWYTLDNRSGRNYAGVYDYALGSGGTDGARAGQDGPGDSSTTTDYYGETVDNRPTNELDRASAGVHILSSGFVKAFSPVAIAPGANTTLTFTITNPNLPGEHMTNVGFSDPLPADLFYTGTTTGNTCGGAVAYSADLRTLTFSGGTLNARANLTDPATTCTIDVEVTSAIPNAYTNQTSVLSYDVAGITYTGIRATADLLVSKDLGMHKQFAPSPLAPGQVATLTFTLINTTASTMINIEFFEFLPLGSPAGFTAVADPAAATNNGCGGTWNPQPGDIELLFTGGTLAPGSTCTLTVNISASANAAYVNRVDPANNADLINNRGAGGNENSIAGLDNLVGGNTPADRQNALNAGTINRSEVVFSADISGGGPVANVDISDSNAAGLQVLANTGTGATYGTAATPVPVGTPELLPATGGRPASPMSRSIGWLLVGLMLALAGGTLWLNWKLRGVEA